MTAQHFRFGGAALAIKREIERGVLGEVYHARSWMLRRNAFIPTPTFVYKALRHEAPPVSALRERLSQAAGGTGEPLAAVCFHAHHKRHVGKTVFLRSLGEGCGFRLGDTLVDHRDGSRPDVEPSR